ncbi:uncharacterized protein MONOS_14942c2 [Monocercomonoides exilis]|uniref:uncharacterized protein n=1 Tax=Monocercomonoides exilis TaxID=2049356 RepID=UPI00355AA4EB|nr:hypothetical protein MONOS_14942c1 [Monocercomonoides exilis]KAH7829219.1 hypothetical protein MONOS_14942c2 [Monocercomonoides exilis]|eukprot:MONOS_14942.1-p1 / transcript=MONOS_14942.1 / gene=MONOS_14942 / organism=Monocercomonoides_exilis_PA203 / gene_product=unspecified product / transcript_product=unspecified product / location=Mono_scaffold01111:10338-11414(-) / protein_length=359 / sequence_SO=supercontig / SO=protein_coding / is_pseudo=false
MHTLTSGTLTVSHCAFNDCSSYWCGGGIMCYTIKAATVESSTFNCCVSSNRYGGGVYLYNVSSCARVSGCEFKNCQAIGSGGGLKLDNFQVSGIGCVGNESGEGESACVFDCCFTSCSVTNTVGGGMYCVNIPATQFKMRSVQFISCSATSTGGGLCLHPNRATAPNDKIYCFFIFFHECKCSAATPYGHDMIYYDNNNLYLSQNNPFYECYTTNTDDQRVCYGYWTSDWAYQLTDKKEWLNEWSKVLFVGVNGKDSSGLCGMGESAPCKTVGHAVEMGLEELSSSVMLMEGNHVSEATTIDIGEKKISVIGKGRETCSIGTETNFYISSFSSFSFSSLLLPVFKIFVCWSYSAESII